MSAHSLDMIQLYGLNYYLKMALCRRREAVQAILQEGQLLTDY